MKYILRISFTLSFVAALLIWIGGYSEFSGSTQVNTKFDDAYEVDDGVFYIAARNAIHAIESEGMTGMVENTRRCYDEISSRSDIDDLAYCYAQDVAFYNFQNVHSKIHGLPPDDFFLSDSIHDRLARGLILANIDNNIKARFLMLKWKSQIDGVLIPTIIRSK